MIIGLTRVLHERLAFSTKGHFAAFDVLLGLYIVYTPIEETIENVDDVDTLVLWTFDFLQLSAREGFA